MFDFTGGELVGGGLFCGLVNQFKEDTGELFKQAIEDGKLFGI
ncbi:hypothetical protein [Coleofasciculus sp. A1-SPW-01]